MKTILRIEVDHPRELDIVLHDEVEDLVADEPMLIHVMPPEDEEVFLFAIEVVREAHLQWLFMPRVM